MDSWAALGAFGIPVATSIRRKAIGAMSVHEWPALTFKALKAVTSIRISRARREIQADLMIKSNTSSSLQL